VNDPEHPFGPLVGRFDDGFDAALDRLRGNPVADRVFYGLSEAANFSVLWHALNVARLVVRPDLRRDVVRLAVALGVESVLVNQGLKRLFRRARPAFDGDRPHELRTPSTSSFPSGHASSAFLVASLLTASHRRGQAAWYVLAALVALSRPYVRIHHASDVAGGAVVGDVLGRLVQRVWRV
jgi:undecaprenyl-diphosphatase